MGFPTLEETFDTMYSTTWPKVGTKVIDQMFYKMPLMYWFTKTLRKSSEGGRWIGRQIRLRTNTAGKSFGRGATFDQVDLDAVTMTRFLMRNVGIPLTRYWEDEQINAGKAAIVKIVQENMENTVSSFKQLLQDLFWATTPGSTDPLSLPYYVREDPTSATTIAGIDQSAEADWRNQYQDCSGNSFYTHGLKFMRDIAMLAEKWGTTKYIICGKDAFSIYDDVALEQKRITDSKMGDAEFTNTGWKGIPLVLDYDAPDDSLYGLDSSAFELNISPNAYFKWTKWKEIPNALDKVAQLVARMQLICTKRKSQWVLFNISA